MLKLPAFSSEEPDCTIYQDAYQFWKFYVVPNEPSVRLNKEGDPVFLLIKYAFSDASREENEDLPRGGGYLVFDTELKLAAGRIDEIKGKLKEHVQAEFERLSALDDPREATRRLGSTFNHSVSDLWGGDSFDAGAPVERDEETGEAISSIHMTVPSPSLGSDVVVPVTCPSVVIAEPIWVDGKVQMFGPTVGGGLVRASVEERPAANFGNMTASFAMDLTEDGATFMQKTLVNEDGSPGTDLTPIQVAYELTMLAKLPPARAHIRISMSQAYSASYEYFHEGDGGCAVDGEYYTSENLMELAVDSGIVSVKVDAGGVTDEDVIEELTRQANTIARDIITQRFAEKKEHHELDTVGDHTTSTDEIYVFKRVSEIDMTDFEQVIELNPTIRHTINPQGTMQTFLASTDGDMTKFVREVDLEDPFFETLGLEVRAYANWEEDDIQFVEVEVLYADEEPQSFTFDPGALDVQAWSPGLVDGERSYQYRWRVAFNGQEPEPWNDDDAENEGLTFAEPVSAGIRGMAAGFFGDGWGGGRQYRHRNNAGWVTSTARHINVSVETPGKLEVEVSAEALDLEHIVSMVMVDLRYQDPDLGVDAISHTVLLSKANQTATWSKMIYKPWRRPVEYRVMYILEDGRRIQLDWETTQGVQRHIVVAPPPVATLDVTMIPSGDGWDLVNTAIVNLRHKRPGEDGSLDSATYRFDDNKSFAKWSQIVPEDDAGEWEYDVFITYTDGGAKPFEEHKGEGTGDGVLPVIAIAPRRLKVEIMAAAVDFKVAKVVKVHLWYVEPAPQPPDGLEIDPSLLPPPTRHTHTLALVKSSSKEEWTLPLEDDWPIAYEYQLTYHLADGEVVVRPPVKTEESLIVVPAYRAEEA